MLCYIQEDSIIKMGFFLISQVFLVAGICLCCLSTFAVISLGESQSKEAKMAPVLQPLRPMLNPPTITTNTTLLKPFQEMKKLQVSGGTALPPPVWEYIFPQIHKLCAKLVTMLIF